MFKLTICNLSTMLTQAKEDHTRWEERYRMEGDTPPVHRWENWYATYIYKKIQASEIEGAYSDGVCSAVPRSEQLAPRSDSEPASPDPL